MPRRPTLLKMLVAERHLTYETFRSDYEQAARTLGLDGLTIDIRQFDRWLYGQVKTAPQPSACRVLELMFGRHVTELLAPPPSNLEEQRVRAVEERHEDSGTAAAVAKRADRLCRPESALSLHPSGSARFRRRASALPSSSRC